MPLSSTPVESKADDHALCPLSAEEKELIAALRNIRFGALEVTMHNGKIVQIERKEKTRFG